MTVEHPTPNIARHVLADFFDCPQPISAGELARRLSAAAEAAGATILGGGEHDFAENAGATAFIMLAESHISAHTWPEHGLVAIDIFICGEANADAALDALRDSFQPARESVAVRMRGAGEGGST